MPLLVTNDFTSPDLNNLSLLDIMTFGHSSRVDINLLNASGNVFELMPVTRSK